MTHTDEMSCFVSNQYNVILPLNFLLSYLRRLRAGDTFVTRLGKMNIYLYLRDEVFCHAMFRSLPCNFIQFDSFTEFVSLNLRIRVSISLFFKLQCEVKWQDNVPPVVYNFLFLQMLHFR